MRNVVAVSVISLVLHFAAAKSHFYNLKPFSHKPLNDVGEPLILTPYIKRNAIQEAKALARVELPEFQNVTSYSGFFTVDESVDANLFFWYFPSASNNTNDPVLLWLQGGPGVSSLYGLFTENGPFTVINNTVGLREYSWHKNYSILYIDQPVGTGYSFTNGSLVTNQTQVGNHLYSALIQFFTVFSELQDNAFFITGESYGGKYVPAISYTIYKNNPTANLTINLQGLIIGNGLSDPRHQFKYGELLYQLGLIDLPTLQKFQESEDLIVKLIESDRYQEASYYWNEMLDVLFYGNTALDNIYNFIKDEQDDPTDWEFLIVRDDVRQALHVGNQQYDVENDDVYTGLYADITRSVADWVSELLDNYRVLVFNGQLDIIVGYILTANYLQNLDFNGAAEYKNATRNVWYVGNKVAGYVKTAGKLTEVMVRDAGHMVPADQPVFAYDLITSFIQNRTIA